MAAERAEASTLKVDLVTRFAPVSTGGTQRLVRDVAAALAAECDVRILAGRLGSETLEWAGRLDRVPPWPAQEEPETGAPIYYYGLSRRWAAAFAPILWSPNRFHPGPVWRHYRELLDRSYARWAKYAFARYHAGRDVVHRFGGSKLALATVRAAHLSGVPVVINPLAHRAQWDDDPWSAMAYREADVVIAESAEARGLYLELGVPAERVLIGRHTCKAPVAGVGDRLREDHRISGDVVLFIGSAEEYKGAPIVLALAARVRNSMPDVSFVFVGRGHDSGRLDNVIVLGEVSDEQKLAWLDAASLLLLPSGNESYGLVLDEAWAAGVPVVTSDIPELAGRVAEAGAGVSVPRTVENLERVVTALLSDPDQRGRLGRSGRSYWERELSPDAYATWHINLYRRLATSAGFQH